MAAPIPPGRERMQAAKRWPDAGEVARAAPRRKQGYRSRRLVASSKMLAPAIISM